MSSIRWTLVGTVLAAVLAGCQESQPPIIFIPEASTNVAVYYRAGQPLAALDADSVAVVLSVSPLELAGTKYLRVYLAVLNEGNEPILLIPATALQLRYKLSTWDGWRISTPSTPTQLLNEVEAEKARAQIAAVIGAQLRSFGQAITTQPTTISGPGGTYTVNDLDEKLAANARRTQAELRADLAEQQVTFGLLARSLNQGILRTNTVFPGEGVQGFVYLPIRLEQGRWITNANGTFFVVEGIQGRIEDCVALIDLRVPGVKKSIGFTAAIGE